MTNQVLCREDLNPFLEERDTPCLSLYQPTFRSYPENAQDPIRYKNLLKSLEQALSVDNSRTVVERLMEPFRTILADRDFWNHTWDGLAVLGGKSIFRVFKLQRPVSALATVGHSFHVKPLLRVLQSSGLYQVLAVNRREIMLFEGDRDHLDKVELAPGVPRTVSEVLGAELTEPHQTVASYGGTALGSNMRHGHGSKQDELNVDEERFFRAVDRAILEKHSRAFGRPLILAALGQYQHVFRQNSHNPFLMANGVEIDPWSINSDQLRQKTWNIVEPEILSQRRKLMGEFQEAKSKGTGSDELETVAQAAVESRVGTLLVEAERQIPGAIEAVTGQVRLGEMTDPGIDDVLDDLAELVLRKGGQVLIVPAADMPSSTGVAATFRY